MHVKKGDMVLVLTGKDAGKKGKIIKAIPKSKRVIVEGINRMKKHQRPTRALPQGGILTIEAAVDISNVMLICSKCDRPTRSAYKFLSDNEKVRYCKKCGETLD